MSEDERPGAYRNDEDNEVEAHSANRPGAYRPGAFANTEAGDEAGGDDEVEAHRANRPGAYRPGAI